MTTEFLRHLNEIVGMILRAKNSAEKIGYSPRYEAADLLLDCINSGLEESNYKKCACNRWHDEQGDLCDECQNFASALLKDRLAWLGK